MIHQVFERFVANGLSFRAPDARERMLEMARDAFKGLDAVGRAPRHLAQALRARRRSVPRVGARAAWRHRVPRCREQGRVGVRGRTRAALCSPARPTASTSAPMAFYEILDFKTGGVPASKDMTAFEAPQLLLEAAMVKAAAFPASHRAIPPPSPTSRSVSALPRSRSCRSASRPSMTLMDAVDEIARRTQRHILTFLMRDGHAMPARIRPRLETGRKPRPGDYDHLARTDEWTLTAGVDDP